MQLGQRAASVTGLYAPHCVPVSLPGRPRTAVGTAVGLSSLLSHRAARTHSRGLQRGSSATAQRRSRCFCHIGSQQSSADGPNNPEQQPLLQEQQQPWQRQMPEQQQHQQPNSSKGLSQFVAKMLGSMALLAVAAGVSVRPSYAASFRQVQEQWLVWLIGGSMRVSLTWPQQCSKLASSKFAAQP